MVPYNEFYLYIRCLSEFPRHRYSHSRQEIQSGVLVVPCSQSLQQLPKTPTRQRREARNQAHWQKVSTHLRVYPGVGVDGNSWTRLVVQVISTLPFGDDRNASTPRAKIWPVVNSQKFSIEPVAIFRSSVKKYLMAACIVCLCVKLLIHTFGVVIIFLMQRWFRFICGILMAYYRGDTMGMCILGSHFIKGSVG